MKTYTGLIKELKSNEIFVFGSNPEGKHGAGTAKIAVDRYGVKYGQGRGMQGQSYGLITKNLTEGYIEKRTGDIYSKSGMKSITLYQIWYNIRQLYSIARDNPDKDFLIAYTASGTNLNGYTSKEMAELFKDNDGIPENIVFEDEFAKLIQEL